MITWIIDNTSGTYIGGLTPEESVHVKQILTKHGNPFKEVQTILIYPGLKISSYQELLDQEKEQYPI